MDIKYVVPSYKRKDVLFNKTLVVLNKYKIDKKDIYVFVANEEQFNEYIEVKNAGYNLIIGEPGLIQARNFIINYFEEGQKIFSLDDDVKEIETLDADNKLIPIDNLKTFAEEAFNTLKQHNFQLGGIYAARNSFFMKKSKPISLDLKYIIGACYFFINDKELILDPKYSLCEDYFRNISSYIKYNGLIRFNHITIHTKYYTKEGGLADERKGEIEGKTPEEICKIKLFDDYPQYVRIVKKKNKTDIALRTIKKKPTY